MNTNNNTMVTETNMDLPYDGCEGQWPGDGSGMDDFADFNANEADDYSPEWFGDDDSFDDVEPYGDDDGGYNEYMEG